MSPNKTAADILAQIEADFIESEVDGQVGAVLIALANLRANREQMRAQLKAQFFTEKAAEFESFVAVKRVEMAAQEAEVRALLSAPAKDA